MQYYGPMKQAIAAFLAAGTFCLSAQTVAHAPTLHAVRGAASDLEVSGAVPDGKPQFLTYEELRALPQVRFKATNDSNYPAPAELAGVSLDQLRRSLALDADMVLAICADGYRSNYPVAYLAAHHPVLVLTVNGKEPAAWPKSGEGGELGPYVIANPGFVPSFKVLSHTDEAQIPFQVVRLDFRSEREVLGPITPKGNFAPDSPVMQGYQIAQQNCYRCHNQGAEGGQMAGIPWPVLGAFAKGNADFFARYVRTPQAVNPHSKMAGSPGYDDQTIAALRAYFTTFATGEKE
jgi:hypothetical protein